MQVLWKPFQLKRRFRVLMIESPTFEEPKVNLGSIVAGAVALVERGADRAR